MAHQPAGTARSSLSPRRLPAALALLVGVALSLLLAALVAERERLRVQSDFQQRAVEWIGAIERARDVHFDTLRTVRTLQPLISARAAQEGGDVGVISARDYLRSTLERRPGLTAIYWLPRVPAAQRPQYESELAALTGASGLIHDRTEGTPVPAEARAEYFPVSYADVTSGPALPLGRDLAARPDVRAVLDAARDGDEIRLLPWSAFAADADATWYLILAPLYTTGQSIATVEQRRQQLVGFLAAQLDMGVFLRSGLIRPLPEGVSARVTDLESGATVAERGMTEEGSTPQLVGQRLPRWEATRDFGGRRWRVALQATTAYAGQARWWLSGLVGGAGVALSGSLAAYLWLTIGRTAAVERTVRERTAALLQANAELEEQVSERQRAEAALRASEDRFRALVQSTSDVVVVLDDAGLVRFATPAAEQVFEQSPDQLLGLPLTARLHPDDAPALAALLRETVSGAAGARVELRTARAEGGWRQIEVEAADLRAVASVGGLVLTCHDISERKRLEERLRYQAFHDALTGLPNRALFMEWLGAAVAGLERDGSAFAISFLDLDVFKVVNDSLGHGAGDSLLVQVAARLTDVLDGGGLVARFGGDEFVVLASTTTRPAAEALAARLLQQFRWPFRFAGREIMVSASVGVALAGHDEPDVTAAELLRRADVALYHAKGQGKARAVVHEARMNAEALLRFDLAEDLRHAVERGEVRVLYQPVLDLRDDRLVGVEALARWQHPRLGVVMPDTFIPIAEETGLIGPLFRSVLHTSCQHLAGWQAGRPDAAPLQLSVNLSARQFQQTDIVSDVVAALAGSGLIPSALCLEITEGVLMDDPTRAETMLQQLRRLGVRVAIDDFGSGYCSLGYLRRFAVDALKIDRAFVADLDQDHRTEAIVAAVALLGDALALDVVAEGIETPAQARRLRTLGCTHGQGYLYAHPLNAEQFEAYLTGQSPAHDERADEHAA